MNAARARVAQRLELLGPGPVSFYRDACHIVEEIQASRLALPTASHIVAHLLREVDSGVRKVLYAQLVDPPPLVTPAPPSEPSPLRESPSRPHAASAALGRQSSGRAIPLASPGTGADSLSEPAEQRQRVQVTGILSALGFDADGPEAHDWLALGRGSTALNGGAHRDALNAPRPLDERFIATLDAMTGLLDTVLDRFAGRYAGVYDQLDELLAVAAPTSAHLKRLQQELPNTPHTRGYFFERLRHPGWIEPLRARGYFSAPPPPVVDPAQGTLGYAHWFEADYLLRMAPQSPTLIADIIAAVPATENVRVQVQLIEVILALRPQDRAALASRVEEWVAAFGTQYWGNEVPRFALALLHEGELELALSLGARLLELPPDWRGGITPRAERSAVTRERAWHLRESAETFFPALCRAAPVRTIELLAAAIDLHAGGSVNDADTPFDSAVGRIDYSEYWADDLGDRDGIEATDLRELLTFMLHTALRQVGVEAPATLPAMAATLRHYNSRVLRRVELAALAELVRSEDVEVRAAALPFAVERLTSTAVMTAAGLATETGRLLPAAFPHAEPPDRKRILDALVPPAYPWLPHEHAQARRARWRRDRLALLQDYLPSDEREELTELTASEGVPQPLEETSSSSVMFAGLPSPLDEATVRSMSLDDLLAFLASWQPGNGRREPSREGLAGVLRSVTAADPDGHAAWGQAFIGQHPAYVSGLLEGFRTAARSGRRFAWAPILSLMAWVVAQAAPIDDMSESDAEAIRWRELRGATADLAGLALGAARNQSNTAAFEERDRLWKIVSVLAEDVNPSPAFEERWGGQGSDPANLAINTVRPQAVAAAIWFAYWSAGHRGGVDKRHVDVLAEEPAVADLLERHLDPSIDSSVSVRAAVGQWLTWLARTDARWVAEHHQLLFPQASEYTALRDALFNACLVWTLPHTEALSALEPEYRAAIDRMGDRADDVAERDANMERRDDHLVEHVVTLYWWGAFTIDETSSLIQHLFAHADLRRRTHALEHIGRGLHNAKQPLDPELIDRMRLLWEWRARELVPELRPHDNTAAATKGPTRDAGEARQELMQFGLWFASGHFEPAWALTRLEEALSVAGDVAWSGQVAERLANLAKQEPLRVAECLLRVNFARSNEPWTMRRWLDRLPVMLGPALESEEPAVLGVAHGVINRVVAAGFTEHRALLRPSSGPSPKAIS